VALLSELLVRVERIESRLRQSASSAKATTVGSRERPVSGSFARGQDGGTYEITVDSSGNVVAERVR